MGGFASSKILEVHGKRMVDRTFDPGFLLQRSPKDLNLALSAAKAMGVALPNTATCQELFNACAARGGSTWDHSAMVKASSWRTTKSPDPIAHIGSDLLHGGRALAWGLSRGDDHAAPSPPSTRDLPRRMFDAAVALANHAVQYPRRRRRHEGA